MGEDYGQQASWDSFFADINTRIRELEEKQRVLRDRILLTSKSFIKERDKNFKEIQAMKKEVIKLSEDNRRIKALLLRLGEGMDLTARKEELRILQRQFDLFRGN